MIPERRSVGFWSAQNIVYKYGSFVLEYHKDSFKQSHNRLYCLAVANYLMNYLYNSEYGE